MGIHSGSCVGGVVGSKVYGSERHEFRSRFLLVVGKQRRTENAYTGHQYNILI